MFVRCDASIFLIRMCYAQTISCSSKKGKDLFIRSSKLFDSTPPIKTDDESLGCGCFSSGFFFTPQGGRQVGNRKHGCTVLWIFKARSHMGRFSQPLYFTKGEFGPEERREIPSTLVGQEPCSTLSEPVRHVSVTITLFTHPLIHPSRNSSAAPVSVLHCARFGGM